MNVRIISILAGCLIGLSYPAQSTERENGTITTETTHESRYLTTIPSSKPKKLKINGVSYEIHSQNEVIAIAGNVDGTTLTIPEEVEIDGQTYRVTAIMGNKKTSLQWGKTVEEIILPNTVREIHMGAFFHQTSLRRITLSENLEIIGDMAFSMCENLEEIIFPKKTKKIGASAFHSCSKIEQVILPPSLENIGTGVFTNCNQLEIVNMYDTQFTEIHMNFLGPNTKLLYLPAHLQNVQNVSQFSMSNNLGVTMSYEALVNLSKRPEGKMFLKKIQLLGLTDAESIDMEVLKVCPELRFLQILWSVKAIGNNAFSSTTNRGKLIEVGMSNYNNMTHIGDYAFRGNPQLAIVELPQTLQCIGKGAFMNCKALESISLPISLTSIGVSAFSGCEKLKNINGLNSNIEWGTVDGTIPPGISTQIHGDSIEKTYKYYALGVVSKDLNTWQPKKEYETTAQWQSRVTPETRNQRVKQAIAQAKKEYIERMRPQAVVIRLGTYDADYQMYSLDLGEWGKQYIQVPLDEAPAFKEHFANADATPTYGIKDNKLAVVSLEIVLNGKTYRNTAPVEDAGDDLAMALPPLEVDLEGGQASGQHVAAPTLANNSDVDMNIPETATTSEQTFAVIIANEQYTRENQVPFALRDGEIFARYCHKTLGIPEKNIRLVKNATLNDMKFQLNWLKQILSVHNGAAKAIVYYAGHGIPDEKQQSAYLLPIDGYGSDPSTGFSLKDFYATLNNAPAKSVTVFLDACFSGAKRESGMMSAARGVAIKVKQEAPQGNIVVFTAAQGDETAYQYKEKGHGMFTYFLLKKLQESKGETTLGELETYITTEVKKTSLLNNNKIQTPTVIPAQGMSDWQERTLK